MEKYSLNRFLKIRHIIVCLIFFFFTEGIVSAQVHPVLDSCLQKLSGYQSGDLSVKFREKSLFHSDTLVRKQSVLFYVDDSLKNHILFSQDSSVYAISNGRYIYYSGYEDKVLLADMKDNPSTKLAPHIPYLSGGKYLADDIYDENNRVTYLATENLNGADYAKFEIEFPLTEDIPAGIKRMVFYIYIHAKTYLPDKVIFSVDYFNTNQYHEIEIRPDFLYKEIHPTVSDSINRILVRLYDQYRQQPVEIGSDSNDAPKKETLPQSIPVWSLPTLTGDTLHFEALSSRLVLLDFWYVNCRPCLLAIEQLVKLDSIFRQDNIVKIIGVNVWDTDIVKMKSIVDYFNIQYAIVYQGMKLAKDFGGGNGFPRLFLIDTETKEIIWYERGYSTKMKEELTRVIEGYLKK